MAYNVIPVDIAVQAWRARDARGIGRILLVGAPRVSPAARRFSCLKVVHPFQRV